MITAHQASGVMPLAPPTTTVNDRTAPSMRINNLDLIRLAAACQVVLNHAIDHFDLDQSSGLFGAIYLLAKYFPGVPVFFFISGFLISKSYESCGSIPEYTRNRMLRIYPALIACTALSYLSLHALGYLPRADASTFKTFTWLLGQATFVQFFNPEFMRAYGVGVLNGSLWTIAVELQFYLVLPIMYSVFRLKARRGNLVLCGLTVVFLAFNLIYWRAAPEDHPSMALKLLGVSFLPWFYMFLLGVLAQRNFRLIHSLLAGKGPALCAIYWVVAYLADRHLGWNAANDIHPVLFVLLAACMFSLAYTRPNTAHRVLKGNDISYGLYIFHMPIVNALLYMGFAHDERSFCIAVLAALLMALLSWLVVERPFLSLKRSGIGRQVQHAAVRHAVQ